MTHQTPRRTHYTIETAPGQAPPGKRNIRRAGNPRGGWSLSKSIFDKLSNETHFVGLSFEKAAARRSALAYARTFASREVFLPTYTPPAKMFCTLFAPAGANSARHFRQIERPRRYSPRAYFVVCGGHSARTFFTMTIWSVRYSTEKPQRRKSATDGLSAAMSSYKTPTPFSFAAAHKSASPAAP